MSQMFFNATVLDRRALTPGMVRLTFGGPDLAAFAGTGVPDEYLRLFFPDAASGRLYLPVITEDGRWTYPDGQDVIRCSTYTVRNHRQDKGEIDIDFVVHEGGLASEWAQKAAPGDTITINRPRGLYTPPGDARWQLLMADATGLPALARILETMPEGIETRVFVEVAEPAHEQPLAQRPGVSITWLHGSGNGIAASRMEEVIRSLTLPATPGYIWVAGEQKVLRAIRRHVRKDLGYAAENYELVGYWIHEGEAWEARWKALPESVKAAIDASWDSGRDREELVDEYHETLDKFGL
ncbi:MAG: siderophore-interacting protein [Devosia sp.]|uniref:siderophore-interacting protein n=1 Tax=Devosia sp. TaxID=1871048 RepID=UPI0024CD9EB5|nr:siderophore-interacting protein [Devosia sp.]UYO00171.1 MAG: siderophore-interacting protein [Devosia sp.]